MRLLKIGVKISLALLLTINVAIAQLSFSNMIFFGDSLTDIGNEAHAPYTNEPGVMWPQTVTEFYALPLKKSGLHGIEGGNDWAVAGATSLDVVGQIQDYLALNPHFNEDDLVFVWIGGNDILNKVLSPWPNPVPTEKVVAEAMANIATAFSLLEQAGAKNIIALNLFSIDVTPGARLAQLRWGDEIIVALRDVVDQFNRALAAQTANTTVTYYDANSQLNLVLENQDTFGFSNVTDQLKHCLRHCNPDEYLFWDTVHPTNAAHQFMGQFIIDFIEGNDKKQVAGMMEKAA